MNRKTRRIILIIYAFAWIVLMIGATYAYFQAVLVTTVTPKVEINSATTEVILFDAGMPLFINPTPDNFAFGMESLSSETFARANLTLAEGMTELSHTYNLFLNITDNTLLYTTAEATAELVLEITDPNGNVVTDVPGLNYVTVTDGLGKSISGFDITTKKGKFNIASNYEIKTSSNITHRWNAKVTFVNLTEDQQANKGKELKGTIQIEKVT